MGKFFHSLRKAAGNFSQDDCMTMGAAIAYYAIFSLPPLLVLALTIAGYFGVDPKEFQKAVQGQWGVATSSNDSGNQQQASASGGGAMGQEMPKPGQFGIVSRIVGVVILLFSASGLFGQLQYSLNRVWGVKPDPKRTGIISMVLKRVFSFGMVLVVAFLLLISMVLTMVVDNIVAYFQGDATDQLAKVVGIGLNNLAAFLVSTLLFAAMFKVLPDAKMAWRDVWIGAAFTALFFIIGKALIGLYLQHTDLASGWGSAAASMIGALVWVYYSSLILLFGAELTEVWASEFGRGIQPAVGAVPAKAAG